MAESQFPKPDNKTYIPHGFEFRFIHPDSETCRKGKSGMTFSKNIKRIRVPILDSDQATTEALKQTPSCDDCGTKYEFFARDGRYGKWDDSNS